MCAWNNGHSQQRLNILCPGKWSPCPINPAERPHSVLPLTILLLTTQGVHGAKRTCPPKAYLPHLSNHSLRTWEPRNEVIAKVFIDQSHEICFKGAP